MWTGLQLFGLGAAGALSYEVVRVYELYGKLRTRRFKAVYSSGLYWVMTAAIILVSGFLAWAINHGAPGATVWQVLISGIAARTIIAKPIEVRAAHQPAQLGESDAPTIREIFG